MLQSFDYFNLFYLKKYIVKSYKYLRGPGSLSDLALLNYSSKAIKYMERSILMLEIGPH